MTGDHISRGPWATCPANRLAQARYRSPRLFESLGRQLGAIDAALSNFDHPAVHRDFYWDIANARATVSTHRSMLTDAELGAAIDTLADRFDRHTAPLLDALPRAVVHGDPNDYNILVGGDADVESRGQSVTGIVDLGDMVYSYRVADLAIAMAYVMLDAPDPLAVADGARPRIQRRGASRRNRAGRGVRTRDDASVRERVHRRIPTRRKARP